MALNVLLVGRLRPELGVSGWHDGLPVADVRHADAVQAAVGEFASADGAVYVTCRQEDAVEVRRALALISVALPHIVTVLEPIPGPPLAVAVGSALIGGGAGDVSTARQLAAFDLLRSTMWSAVWLPKVNKLSRPVPTLGQHMRGWLPNAGYLAIFDQSPRVVRASRPPLRGTDGAPRGGMMVTADTGAPDWVGKSLASAVQPLGTAELRSWRNPADAFGVDKVAEFVLIPPPLLEVDKLVLDNDIACDGCGRHHPRSACPFCGMAAPARPQLAETHGGVAR